MLKFHVLIIQWLVLYTRYIIYLFGVVIILLESRVPFADSMQKFNISYECSDSITNNNSLVDIQPTFTPTPKSKYIVTGPPPTSTPIPTPCGSPSIIDSEPINICPGSSYNLTGSPDSGTVYWSIISGADKLSINQEGNVTWSSYNQSNWGTDFTGTVKLHLISNPDCFDTIDINGKGFKRPGSNSVVNNTSGVAATYIDGFVGLSGTRSDDTVGDIGFTYQSGSDQCNGNVVAWAYDVNAETYPVSWSISRTGNGLLLGMNSTIALAWGAREGSNSNFTNSSDNIAKNFEDTGNVSVSISYMNLSISLTIPTSSTSDSGTWGGLSEDSTGDWSGSTPHIESDTFSLSKNTWRLGVGSKAERDSTTHTSFYIGSILGSIYPDGYTSITFHP